MIQIPKVLQKDMFRFVLLNEKTPIELFYTKENGFKTGDIVTTGYKTALQRLEDQNIIEILDSEKKENKKVKIRFLKDFCTNYRYDDNKLLNHIKVNNYGVLCGVNNLVVIDFDEETYQKEKEKILKDTLIVKTGGSGLYHYYYFLDKEFKKKPVSIEVDGKRTTLVDLQGRGSQVVGPNSINRGTGRRYEIVKDCEISNLTLNELEKTFELNTEDKIKEEENKIKKLNPFMQAVCEKVKIKDVLEYMGTDVSNNTVVKCPLHDMHGKGNLHINDEVAYCYHEAKGYNIFSLWQAKHKVDSGEEITFKTAMQEICDHWKIECVGKKIKWAEKNINDIFDEFYSHITEEEDKEYFLSLDDDMKKEYIEETIALHNDLKPIPLNLSHKNEEERTQVLRDIHFLMRSKSPIVISKGVDLAVNYILDNYKIYITKNESHSEVYVYTNGIYINNGRDTLKKIVYDMFENDILDDNTVINSYTDLKFNKIMEHIESTKTDSKILFADEPSYLIPLRNGLYDLKQNKLINYNPKYKFFSRLNVSYNSEKEYNKFQIFLDSVIGPSKDERGIDIKQNIEDKISLQEFVGYCLHRTPKFDKFLMLIGSGRNGKGKFLKIIQKMFGKTNYKNFELSNLASDAFELSELHSKYINISSEVDKNKKINMNTIKKLTGGDTQSAKRKFLSSLDFTPFAKHIISLNTMPDPDDKTKASFLRFKIIEFKYKFYDKKNYDSEILKVNEDEKKLIKKGNPDVINDILFSKDEMSGILNWAIEGLKRILNQNGFSYNDSIEDITNKFKIYGCSSEKYISGRLEFCSGSSIERDMLLDAYAQFCGENDLEIDTVNTFNYHLRNILRVDYKNTMVDRQRDYYYRNVRFKAIEPKKENNKVIEEPKKESSLFGVQIGIKEDF